MLWNTAQQIKWVEFLLALTLHFAMMSLSRQTNWNITSVAWQLFCKITNWSWRPALSGSAFKSHFPKGNMKQKTATKFKKKNFLYVLCSSFPYFYSPASLFMQLYDYETWKTIREEFQKEKRNNTWKRDKCADPVTAALHKAFTTSCLFTLSSAVNYFEFIFAWKL